MPVYYTGLNASPLFSNQDGIVTTISHLTQIPFSGITDIEIGWNYFLLWQDTKLYITGKISEEDDKNEPRLMQIPEESSGRQWITKYFVSLSYKYFFIYKFFV